MFVVLVTWQTRIVFMQKIFSISMNKLSIFSKSNLYFYLPILILFHTGLNAQSTNFDAFLRGGTSDANTLIKNYMEPLIVGFSYGMSNSWYNTAKAHKTLGFDLTISANLTNVPASKEYFVFNQSDYINVSSTGETNNIPTIMGPDQDNGAELTFSYTDKLTGETISSTFTPGGLGIRDQLGYNVVPSPMVQLGIGTFKNTDIIIRYTPEITYGDFKTSVFGMGIKHDIKQWIPGLKRVPIDIAVLAGFSGFDNTMDVSNLDLQGSNQEAIFNVNNWTVQGIISKKLSVLTLYGSFGYSSVTSGLKMNGTYIIQDEIDPTLSFTVENPVDISYSQNSWRATGGMRFKLGFFTIHADYTWQEYQIASAGIGFSFH